MKKQIIELKEKAYKLIVDARGLAEKAKTEKRAMTNEETVSFDKMFTDASDYKAQAERMEKAMDLETGLNMNSGRKTEEAVEDRKAGSEAHRAAFMKYIVHNDASELRAMSAGTTTEGGFLVPEVLSNKIVTGLNNAMFMRQICPVERVNGAVSLGVPYVSADASDAEWTTEILMATADDTLALGKRSLTPHQLCKLIKVSQKLLQLSQKAEDFVISRIVYKMAAAQENAFLNGEGTTQPLGVFHADANGINTDRDVAGDNSATAITADTILDVKYGVAAQYRAGAAWILHREAVAKIAKLKGGDGQYLWQPSLAAGKPDLLAGHTLYESEYAPHAFTAGLYVGIFGNFGVGYQIAESIEMSIQRLNELYAATNQVGFIPRVNLDGMPVLPAAFARLTMGA